VNPQTIGNPLVREVPVIRADTNVEQAARQVVDSGQPALPVVDANDCFVGLFGEREFMSAMFPGYVGELAYAAFVPRTLDEALEKRAACRGEPVSKHMNKEHIDVPPDFSDVQVAETFLHHRVLIVPVTDGGRVLGAITRSDFFRRLAERFLDGPTAPK
jgi:CBS domain-containing protein